MNKKYGKIELEVFSFAPSVLIIEDKQIISPSEEDYLANGYLPIVLGIDLEYKEGFEIVTSYRIVETEEEKYIERVQEYKALPPLSPQPPTLEERMTNVEGETETLTQANSELTATVDSILTDVLPSLMGM